MKGIREFKEVICKTTNQNSVTVEGVTCKFELTPDTLVFNRGAEKVVAGLCLEEANLTDYELIISNLRVEFRKKD